MRSASSTDPLIVTPSIDSPDDLRDTAATSCKSSLATIVAASGRPIQPVTPARQTRVFMALYSAPMLHSFSAFLFVSLLILIIPGPAVIYIATRSATQGRLAGIVSVLGVASGGVVHVIAAAAGLSMLLARSAAAMQYIRFAGALYLVYLGIEKFRGASAIADAASKPIAPQPLHRIYRDGVIVNVLNPKTSLFFLSFLPQFIDPHHGSQTMQLLGYGGFFVVLALFTDGSYAMAAAAIGNATRGTSLLRRRLAAWSSGTIYLCLGAAAALS